MALKIVITLLIIFCALFIYVKANTLKVVKISRSQLIEASAETLFPYINNPHKIQEWNPFIEGDDTVKITYDGPEAGAGAQWTWEGNKAGAGHATIIASELNRRVSLRLDFKKPFNVTNDGDYVLIEKGNATEVVWTIDETATIPRVLNNFVSLDRIVGSQFDKGLAKLKLLVEAKK